jgi:anti-anti-sigma regulatory factor
MVAHLEDEIAPVLVAVVSARGRVEGRAVRSLSRDLERATDSGATRLLVDLGEAQSVGTTALNALLSARNRLCGPNARMAVVLPRRLRRLFLLLQLDLRFALAGDRFRAVQLLGLTSEPAHRPAQRQRFAA